MAVHDATAPTAFITFTCVESASDDVSAYDAQFVLDSVTRKYGLTLSEQSE